MIGLSVILLAACASNAPSAKQTTSAAPHAGASTSVGPAPSQCCQPSAMSVAITAVQKITSDPYVDHGPPASGQWSCPAPTCAWGGQEHDGTNAATVFFSVTGIKGFGEACVLYVAKRPAAGWQYVEGTCGQNLLGPVLNIAPTVWVSSGCANLRSAPSLTGQVNECVSTGSVLPPIDQGPVYADSHLWWHSPRGWIAQDFLMPADQAAAHAVADVTFPRNQYGFYDVCGLTGNLSTCPFTDRLKQRLSATEATLCRCQNPAGERLIGTDPPNKVGVVVHVLGGEGFDLVLVNAAGRWLVDDELCLGQSRGTSIYATTDPCPGGN